MLNPDFRDMLSALSDAHADYVVVGAFALAAHGNPRSTGDIDIYIRPDPDNAEKVLMALKAFGAPLDQISKQDLLLTDTVFQIGVVPRRIDLLTGLKGITDFDEAWNGRIDVSIDGLSVPVLGRDTLIKNKSSLGRPQDLADVAWLKSHP